MTPVPMGLIQWAPLFRFTCVWLLKQQFVSNSQYFIFKQNLFREES